MIPVAPACGIGTSDRFSFGGEVVDSKACLCIYGTTLDVAAMTAMVGCAPSSAWDGGPVHAGLPDRIAYWHVEAPAALGFVEKIRYLLDSTSPDAAVWAGIASERRVHLSCVLRLRSQGEGFALPSDVVTEVGARRWDFSVSVFGADGDEGLDPLMSGRTQEVVTEPASRGARRPPAWRR